MSGFYVSCAVLAIAWALTDLTSSVQKHRAAQRRRRHIDTALAFHTQAAAHHMDIDLREPEDTIPDDALVCAYCTGLGVVLDHIDTTTGNAVDKPCPRCSGTGETWGWLG